MKRYYAEGPQPARVLIVGEAPGAQEVEQGRPFIGASGHELRRMLLQAGFKPTDHRLNGFEDVRITNVCHVQPPRNDISKFFGTRHNNCGVYLNGRWPDKPVIEGLDLLEHEVRKTDPDVIIALGATALWALTGQVKIGDWRGSRMQALERFGKRTVFPTYHPAAILRQWSMRYIAVRDLMRACAWVDPAKRHPAPEPNVRIGETYEEANLCLDLVEAALRHRPQVEIAVDLETRGKTFIECIGLAWSDRDAIVIPFSSTNYPNLWSEEEEISLVRRLKAILEHPKAYIIGQNFVYDMQFLAARWGIKPRCHFDTMLAHHVAFVGLPKSLAFMASLYLEDYQFWKYMGREQDHQLWLYNGLDCINTWRLYPVLSDSLRSMGLWELFEFQMGLQAPVLEMMFRGLRLHNSKRKKFNEAVQAEMDEILAYLVKATEDPEFNPRSPQKLMKLFYEDMGIKPYINRKTGNPTVDAEALERISKKEPLLRPICSRIKKYRELGTLKSTFLEARDDPDGRLRCEFKIHGTETYRFSSSENAFGMGLNAQNLPPAFKTLVYPDEGYVLVECDLERADLQVVVWEADDEELKQALREGEDIHWVNARAIFGPRATEYHRKLAKAACHAMNYGVAARTLAATLGLTVKEAEDIINRWFSAHPGIREWHRRTQHLLETERMVTNRFGYRRYYFDRIEHLLPQALAWVGQSTVACVTNRGLKAIHDRLPEVQLLGQIHDSVVCQVPKGRVLGLVPEIVECMKVPVPYDDPLIIGVEAKISEGSWADAEKLP